MGVTLGLVGGCQAIDRLGAVSLRPWIGSASHVVMPLLFLALIGVCLWLLDWIFDHPVAGTLRRIWRGLAAWRDAIRTAADTPRDRGRAADDAVGGEDAPAARDRLNRLSGRSPGGRGAVLDRVQRRALREVLRLDASDVEELEALLAAGERKRAYRMISRARNREMRRTGGWRVAAGVVTGRDTQLNRLLETFDTLRRDFDL